MLRYCDGVRKGLWRTRNRCGRPLGWGARVGIGELVEQRLLFPEDVGRTDDLVLQIRELSVSD